MAEHIGTIVEAGDKQKKDQSGTVFVMKVDTFSYYLHDPAHIAFAREHVGQGVKVTYEPSGKFRNVSSLEVATVAQAPPGNGGYRGKSPEERAEIQEEVAVKAITELWVAGKVSDDSQEVKGLRRWLLAHIGRQPAEPKPAPATKPKKAEDPDKDRRARFGTEMTRLGLTTAVAIQTWLETHNFLSPEGWAGLTAEAQEKAIATAQAEKKIE